MKKQINHLSFFLVFLLLVSCTTSKKGDTPKADISDFLGHWTMEIDEGMVGWLDVRQEENYLDADLLWKWGSVTPASHTYLHDDILIVTRTHNLKRNNKRTQVVTQTLKVKREGEKIAGYFVEPSEDGLSYTKTAFSGTKLKDMPEAPDFTTLKFGEPIELFNGNDLTGWELTNKDQVNGFSAIDGALVNDPVQPEEGEHISYGNLRTVDEYEDFNLKLEVNVPSGSNSGIYLRGIYEIQVLDSYGRPLDSHNMGGIYSRTAPSTNAEKPAGEWQSFDITLCDRHITLILNGIKIHDNVPVYGPTGGALHADVLRPGPIYLQGDHGKIIYRNLVLTPIVK